MNNRNITRYIAAACMGLALMACQEDEWTGRVNSGFQVSLTDGTVSPDTRTAPAELDAPAAADFTLTILRQANGETIYNATCPSAPIEAEPGVYRLTAKHGSNPTLDLDAPYYEGQIENVSVNNNEVKQVSIPCKVANALLSVKYENVDKIAEVYSAYSVTVTVGDKSVEIPHDSAESAYFQAGSSVEATFNGTLLQGGENKSLSLTEALPDSFKAGDHVILTLRVSPDLGIEITQVEVETATVEETIPGEWLPRPKVSAEGFTDNTLVMYETETPTAKFNFNLSAPLQELKFTLDFSDATYQSLNKTYTLSELSAEDKAALTEAGIVLPEIGATNVALDFSGLAAKLTGTTGETLSNSITLEEVKANNRTQGEAQVYTIKTLAPEFTISVQPENVWSKEFTIDEFTVTEGKGNASTIASNLKYQYQDENGDWQDCNRQETRQQVFANHPKKKAYKVRAIYRNAIASNEVDIELETPTQLPNSGMEEWYRTDTKWDFPNYIPRASTETEEFWDTNNEFTFRYNISAFLSAYNGFPAVSYSTASHNGSYSTELRNTAAGPANTFTTVYDQNRVAGMLFIGNYTGTTSTTVANGSISIDEGRFFTVRPTRLTFWYTYTPYGEDTYEVIVKVFDTENNVIAKGNYTSSKQQTSWTEVTIDFTYTQTEGGIIKKANKIYVLFQSSNLGQANVPYERRRQVTLADYGTATTHSGSVLRIDDISLVYDK